MEAITKSDLTDMALEGEFSGQPQRFTCDGRVVEIFDDGYSPGLMAVEIWHGERLGGGCYVDSYPEGALFIPVDDDATN